MTHVLELSPSIRDDNFFADLTKQSLALITKAPTQPNEQFLSPCRIGNQELQGPRRSRVRLARKPFWLCQLQHSREDDLQRVLDGPFEQIVELRGWDQNSIALLDETAVDEQALAPTEIDVREGATCSAVPVRLPSIADTRSMTLKDRPCL